MFYALLEIDLQYIAWRGRCIAEDAGRPFSAVHEPLLSTSGWVAGSDGCISDVSITSKSWTRGNFLGYRRVRRAAAIRGPTSPPGVFERSSGCFVVSFPCATMALFASRPANFDASEPKKKN